MVLQGLRVMSVFPYRNSDLRSGGGDVMHLFTPDVDLAMTEGEGVEWGAIFCFPPWPDPVANDLTLLDLPLIYYYNEGCPSNAFT